MKKINSLIRERLRRLITEKQVDQKVLDSILDKINKQGKDSLDDKEEAYLEQASKGDVDEELEDDIKSDLFVDDHITSQIESGEHVEVDKLEKASQEVIDEYILSFVDKLSPLHRKELSLASQEAIDKYIRSRGKKGKNIPSETLKEGSQEAIDDHLINVMYQTDDNEMEISKLELASKGVVDDYILLKAEKGIPLLSEREKLKMASSQYIIDKYILSMAENGMFVFPRVLKLGSQEAIDKYLYIVNQKGQKVPEVMANLASTNVRDKLTISGEE